MPDVEIHRLIWVVTGIQLNAELGDRPLAYRIEQELRTRLAARLGPTPAGGLPLLAPAVISDVFYLNHDEASKRPLISIGGPGVNAVSAMLVDKLPTAVAIEETLVVQMDVEMNDRRCAVWGMNHLDTVRAVELFISRGYLDTFVDGVVSGLEGFEE
ncbi:MAG: hypothetical protein ACREIT_02030 [Tepidisphaeraceae bacterium]